jgi:hypothetical protein
VLGVALSVGITTGAAPDGAPPLTWTFVPESFVCGEPKSRTATTMAMAPSAPSSRGSRITLRMIGAQGD